MSTPLVAILVAARTDLPVMEQASAVLEDLGVPHTIDVLSVHRDPDAVRGFVRGARDAGYRVIVAGAAGAAHLPGIVAAHTSLPVIGVPCGSSNLGGADALYSVVQMPSGVPVATVGIDAARNAGILAAQILATAMPEVGARIDELRAEQAGEGREHREVRADGSSGLGFGFQPG